jgi:hypothetical protein
MSVNTFKVGLRNGLTVSQYKNELKRRQVNAMMAHARWAGRHFAKFLLLTKDFNVINARGILSDKVYADTMIANPYCVHPVLVQYALKVTREKLNGAVRSRIA